MNKKGFTLVELSIVLVIIGLLIGGILAAQSMIGTAKIQALVRQIGQFDAAVENFQTKFQQLPGDNNLMGGCAGNNDGIITSDCNGSTNLAVGAYAGEILKFWPDLSAGGLINPAGGSYYDGSATNTIPNYDYSTVAPTPTVGKNGFFMAIGNPTSKNNYYFIGELPSTFFNNLGRFRGDVLNPAQVLAIDTKLDDGLANSGNVSGWDCNAMSDISMEAGCNTRGCMTSLGSTSYSISNSNNICGVRIRMGNSTGNLK